jgi:hypothetical protein
VDRAVAKGAWLLERAERRPNRPYFCATSTVPAGPHGIGPGGHPSQYGAPHPGSMLRKSATHRGVACSVRRHQRRDVISRSSATHRGVSWRVWIEFTVTTGKEVNARGERNATGNTRARASSEQAWGNCTSFSASRVQTSGWKTSAHTPTLACVCVCTMVGC